MQPDREAGFTLIELLVSLVLLTMTALLLLATMTTGRGVEKRAAMSAIAGESVAAAHAILRDRIEAMVADGHYGPGGATVDVRGDDNILSFTAPPQVSLRPAPPQRFRLMLTRYGELSLFSINPLSTRVDPEMPSVIGWLRTPLLGNIASFSIAYFGAAPPDNQRRWRATWHDRPGLPELVRIRVGFPAGDARVWPDLIVHPVTTVNTTCQIDRMTGRCGAGAS